VALRLYKSMAREAEQDHLEVDVASEITAYAQSVSPSIRLFVRLWNTNRKS